MDQSTPLFNDTYIALELLHMPYSDYIQRIPPLERLHYQLYVALKSAKEKHAMERIEHEREIERELNPLGAGTVRA